MNSLDMNMSSLIEPVQSKSRGRRACLAVALCLALGVMSACDNLLEVDLPAQLTDKALEDPDGAVTQLNSILAHFEDGYNALVWELFGRADGGEMLSPRTGSSYFQYSAIPSDIDARPEWFGTLMTSRTFASDLHDRLGEWTDAQVAERAQYLAISSLYEGAVLSLMSQIMCETAVSAGALMTPQETSSMAEAALNRALSEITSAGGDFAMPIGISSSAETMAYGLRAQLRWTTGDKAGALADAERVPKDFMAFVTRDGAAARRNTAWDDGTNARLQLVYGVIDWWEGAPNPVTGQAWPSPIPFTGYNHLGLLSDGRAVRDDGLPIRTEGPHRSAIEDTAVPDTRVKTFLETIQGAGLAYVNAKYDAGDADIPLVNWKEMWLIRAEIEGGQRAIDLVNELRAADDLPLVTYADPANAQQIRYMLIEERRRTLYLEGRFFMTKLQNLDILWFPRGQGANKFSSLTLRGGVRFIMPEDEYVLNPNLTLGDRATGCSGAEAPDPDLG